MAELKYDFLFDARKVELVTDMNMYLDQCLTQLFGMTVPTVLWYLNMGTTCHAGIETYLTIPLILPKILFQESPSSCTPFLNG